MSNELRRFEVTAEAEQANEEITDRVNEMLVSLNEATKGNPYKAVVSANLLIASGIRRLIDMSICPNGLMDALVVMVQAALDGNESVQLAVPANVAATVKRPEGKPS